jgi:hypothetical protein
MSLVTTKLSLGGNNDVITELFLHRVSLSDISAGDGKLVNLFLRCTHSSLDNTFLRSMEAIRQILSSAQVETTLYNKDSSHPLAVLYLFPPWIPLSKQPWLIYVIPHQSSSSWGDEKAFLLISSFFKIIFLCKLLIIILYALGLFAQVYRRVPERWHNLSSAAFRFMSRRLYASLIV